jgi:hypothetical protein
MVVRPARWRGPPMRPRRSLSRLQGLGAAAHALAVANRRPYPRTGKCNVTVVGSSTTEANTNADPWVRIKSGPNRGDAMTEVLWHSDTRNFHFDVFPRIATATARLCSAKYILGRTGNGGSVTKGGWIVSSLHLAIPIHGASRRGWSAPWPLQRWPTPEIR